MRARPSDISDLTLRMTALLKSAYPRLTLDRLAIRAQVEMRVSSAQHYVGISGKAMLLSTSQEIPFAERKMSVLEVVVGTSMRDISTLMREYVDWLDHKPVLRFAVYTPAYELPRGMVSLLQKHGFQPKGGTYERWRK